VRKILSGDVSNCADYCSKRHLPNWVFTITQHTCHGRKPREDTTFWRHQIIPIFKHFESFKQIYRVSIKSFPDYKHLLQENYVEYKRIFLPLLKLVSKILCHVFIVMLQLHNLLVSKRRQWRRKVIRERLYAQLYCIQLKKEKKKFL